MARAEAGGPESLQEHGRTSDAVRTRLWLARHCDVENPRRILYGHLPGFGLSALGRQQAAAMGSRLAAEGITAIVASPLQRAQESADIVAAALPLPVTREVSQDLIEARFGNYLQGVPPAQVPWRRPLWLVHLAWPGLLPGDEKVAAMAARVTRAIGRQLAAGPGEPALLISHGDPIQAFWIEAEGRSRYALHRLGCAKGGMLQLDYCGSRLSSLRYIPPPDGH